MEKDSKKVTINLGKYGSNILGVIAIIVASGSVLLQTWGQQNEAQEDINLEMQMKIADGGLNAYLVDIDFVKIDTLKDPGLPDRIYFRDKDREDVYVVLPKPTADFVNHYFGMEDWTAYRVYNIRKVGTIREGEQLDFKDVVTK